VGQVRRALTLSDREEITRGLAAGWSYKQIAAVVGRDPSVVCREVFRGGGRGFYRAVRSDKAAAKARQRPKLHKLDHEGRLRDEVLRMLSQEYSPEQVVGRLRLDYGDDESMRISHEGIYRWIYALPVGELARLGVALRTGRRQPKPRGSTVRAPKITNIRWIDERPAEATDRQVPGHWEGDLIIGSKSTAASTLVERTSRFTLIIPLENRESPTVTAAIAAQIAGLPDALRRSLTWDCGTEMAAHTRLAPLIDVYFAHPYSPWERPTNENTNGLIRQYLPKGTPIPKEAERLAAIADRLNHRPRRILGFRTPAEVFAELLTSLIASTP